MTHFADLYTPARARPSAHLAHINHHLRLPRSQLWCRVHHPAIKTIFPGQQSVSLLFSKRERETKKLDKEVKTCERKEKHDKKEREEELDEADAEVLWTIQLSVHLHIYLLLPPTFTDSSILPASVLKQ